jgi:hypothetical protein
MTLEYDQARDEMFALFNVAWQANAGEIVSPVPEVRWQGKEVPTKPDRTKFWARVSIQSVIEQQATLSNCVIEPGKKKYESAGLVFVQLFGPKIVATAYDDLQKLAKVARNAFRGKTTVGNVWFRNVRINTLNPEELFYRLNVVAEYEFDEIG